MFSPFLKRILIDICLALALILGLYFLKAIFIDFLISLFHFQDKVNISSLTYCIQRVLFVMLPLLMLSYKTKIHKALIIKYMFIVMGVCYILANAWIFPFMSENSFSTLLTASIPNIFANDALKVKIAEATQQCYLFQYNNAYVFNYLTWNSYDLFGILFSTIQGILFIQIGLNYTTRKTYLINKFTAITCLWIILPLFFTFILDQNFIFPMEWALRNFLLIFEAVFIIIAMKLAASGRAFWVEIMY